MSHLWSLGLGEHACYTDAASGASPIFPTHFYTPIARETKTSHHQKLFKSAIENINISPLQNLGSLFTHAAIDISPLQGSMPNNIIIAISRLSHRD